MAETKTYEGACHCGAVAFTVDLDTSGALKCNCSICTKLGAVWAFAPRSRFGLKSGATKQGDYRFGKKSLHHRRLHQNYALDLLGLRYGSVRDKAMVFS